MSRPLVYTTDATVAVSGLPIVVIDTTALPDSNALPDPETEVPELLKKLPNGEFAIAYFASRAPKSLQMIWTKRVHSILPTELKKRIKRIYIVHARWLAKALNRALAPIVSPKFAFKIRHVRSLANLAKELDITAMDISPEVYLDDTDRNLNAENAALIPIPKQSRSIFGRPVEMKPNNYWQAAFTFLNSVSLKPVDFQPSSCLESETQLLVDILYHAVRREQRLRLYDYGPLVVLAVIQKYLVSLPEPLIRIETCPLPIQDNYSYVQVLLDQMNPSHVAHVRDIVALTHAQYLDYSLIANALGPAIMGLADPSSEQSKIASRVVRNILEYWFEVEKPVSPVHSSHEDSPASSAFSSSSSLHSSSTLSRPLPPALPKRRVTPNKFESLNASLSSEAMRGPMPRELPGKIVLTKKEAPAPNRKAYGRVAEILRQYNDVS